MAIVTLRLPNVKAQVEARPGTCPHCGCPILQRWGGQQRAIKDPHVHHALVYRYRCTDCRRTFRHYPEGVTSAHQSQRLIQLAAVSWVLGLSLRATSAILSVFPVALSHTSIWNDVQALASRLKGKQPQQVRVLGVDGVYPKVKGQEQPTVIAVDLGTGQPVALAAVAEKDWRAVVAWLEPLVEEMGVEVIVTDDLRELAVAVERLQRSHQVCHFHLLRWLWHALEKLRQQLDEQHHPILDEVWQMAKTRPAGAQTRLFALWKELSVRRSRDQKTTALYRLRLLLLRLQENWEKYTLDQRRADVPPTNNGTERVIGRWRIRSHSTRGFKSWLGLEAAFVTCAQDVI
jgi:transposase-like protein